VPAWEDWSRARLPAPRLVARENPDGHSDGGSHDPEPGAGERVGEFDDAGAGERGGEGVGEVLGWAALSPVSARAVYRGVGSVSIYVAPAHARRGIGRALLGALIEASEQAGLWTLEAGIFPENRASVALHARCGFELVGVRRRVGQMPDGRWRDVALYERRSTVVGAD
jgi:RimJ/RimL family protein N-acetyltransferase